MELGYVFKGLNRALGALEDEVMWLKLDVERLKRENLELREKVENAACDRAKK